MLEGLDAIDWYALGHAYGDAGNVPKLIRGLASEDPSVRGNAWWDIFGSLRHQGDVYDTTSLVVPFMIELIADPNTPAKAELLEQFYGYVSDDSDRAIGPFSQDSLDGRISDEKRRLHTAGDAGFSVYAKLLDHPEPRVRKAAGDALTLCRWHYDDVSRLLRERLAQETDAEVRTNWVLLFAAMDQADDAPFVAELAQSEAEPLTRFAAAFVWASLTADRLSPVALAILEEGCRPEQDFLYQLPTTQRLIDNVVARITQSPAGARAILLPSLDSPTESVRRDALLRLLELPDCPPRAIADMIALLGDESAEVRSWAAFTLSELQHEPIKHAQYDQDFAESEEIERRLDRLAPPFVEALLARLQVEVDPNVRRAIFKALKDLGLWSAPALEIVRSVANDRDGTHTVLWVLDSLHHGDATEVMETARLGNRTAWMAERMLLRRAQRDPEPVVAALGDALDSRNGVLAARVLGALGPLAASAITPLQQALQHPGAIVRDRARAAIPLIDPAASLGPPVPDEAAIRRTLGEDAPEALPKLVVQLLNDADPFSQYDALRAIAELGPAALPARSFLLAATEKAWLYYDAFGALARVDPEFVRPRLPELLKKFDSDGESARAPRADAFISYLGPGLQPDAVAFLLACLPTSGEQRKFGRAGIVWAIGQFTSPDPALLTPLIVRVLETDWSEERRRGFDMRLVMLKFLKAEGAKYAALAPWVAPLATDPKLNLVALETLSRIAPWSIALPLIEPFLSAPQPDVRNAAAEAIERLGRLATTDQLPALDAALAHESVVVSRAARSAIERLKSAR